MGFCLRETSAAGGRSARSPGEPWWVLGHTWATNGHGDGVESSCGLVVEAVHEVAVAVDGELDRGVSESGSGSTWGVLLRRSIKRRGCGAGRGCGTAPGLIGRRLHARSSRTFLVGGTRLLRLSRRLRRSAGVDRVGDRRRRWRSGGG